MPGWPSRNSARGSACRRSPRTAGNIFLQQSSGSQAAGSAFGTVASTAAGAAVGVYGGRAISGGYSAIGNSGNAAVNVGTVAGGIISAIVGAPAVGRPSAAPSAASSTACSAARRPRSSRAPSKARSPARTSPARRWNIVEKGGLFRSDKRSESQAITGDLDKALDEGAQQLTALAAKYGAALGLPAERLASVTAEIRVAVTDSAEDNAKAIADALKQYSDALLGSFADDIEPFRKSGETVAQTIERVGGALLTVNDAFELLGVQALTASIDGGKAALALGRRLRRRRDIRLGGRQLLLKFQRASAPTAPRSNSPTPWASSVSRCRPRARPTASSSGSSWPSAKVGLPGCRGAARPGRHSTRCAPPRATARRRWPRSSRSAGNWRANCCSCRATPPALRERERAALDEQPRAVGDQIKALEDQADAAKAAADAAEEAPRPPKTCERQRAISGGVDSVIGDFLKGGDPRTNKGHADSGDLAQGGIESTVPGILGSTREDILQQGQVVGVDAARRSSGLRGMEGPAGHPYGTQKVVDAYRRGRWPTASSTPESRP